MKKAIFVSICVMATFSIIMFFVALPHTIRAVDYPTPGQNITTAIPEASTNQTTPPVIPYEPMPEAQRPTEEKTHVLTFVGDCTLGTMPDWMSYSGCFNNVVGENYDHPFNAVRNYFENDDCTFINLEGVFANDGKPEDKQFTFRGPTEYIQILTGSSVEVANLSNNHTYDFGQAGYDSTTNLLKENCITYVGRNEIALYTTPSGLTIGLYGVYFNLDEKHMKDDIQKLKDMGADIIVAAAHWGIEREYINNKYQTSMAHLLIDAGVDIVWGHHPHVLQPIEEYNGGIIYYSLGNFSFGGNHNPSDKDTAILQQTIIERADGTVELGSLDIIPCRLSSKESYNDFQPTPYHTSDAGYNRVLSKLGLSNHSDSSSGATGDTTNGDSTDGNNDASTETKPVTKPVETLEEKIENGKYMLRRSFGFYKGSIGMEKITKIIFTTEKPSSYDEKWYANLAQTSDIMGYRKGTTVYIVGKHIYANTYSGYMFARLNSYDETLWGSLQSVEGLENLNMSHCNRMPCMFYEQLWTEINGIADWDVSNITDMTMTFAHCTNLTTLDIGKWNTSNVESFSGLFSGHSWAGDMKIKYLPIEHWDTSSGVDMSHIFYGCAQLVEAPVTYWDVSKATTFSHFFADCYKLEKPNIHNWETLSVQNFDAFFNDCHALVSINVSYLETGTCKQFSQMFEACHNLKEIKGMDAWDVSNASYAAFQQMFHACDVLESVDLSAWHSTPDDTARMFANCYALKYVDLSGVDMTKCTWVQEMFWNCYALETIIWKAEYDLSTIEGYDSMMNGCNESVKQITK